MPARDEIQVRPYTPADGPGVREFIREHVRRDHPNTQDWLFEWFYRGFGSAKGRITSAVAIWNGEIAGFRGMFPALFQLPLPGGGMEVVEGGTYAFWNIREELRGKGVGFGMYQKTLELAPRVITGIGSNLETSAPIYIKNRWSRLDELPRYVLPLDPGAVSALLQGEGDRRALENWAGALPAALPVVPTTPDPDAIAAVWERVTFPLGIFAHYRTPEYLRWRFVDSPAFRYLFFGDPGRTGTLVARVETICSRERQDMDGRTVFKLIEILPATPRAWTGEGDPELEGLLAGALRWAADQGCLLADFTCTSSRFGPLLSGALPFRRQHGEAESLVRSLPNLFQPLVGKYKPLNSFIRVAPDGRDPVEMDFDDVYMVRSENDQDRPNLLGREGSWVY
ncbi:MAG: hypothetical protein QNK04_06955 [Myxococcota bacterium]|nr:hypothetical protein [Myxococcota bacterium]